MVRTHEYPVIGVWYWDIEHADQFEIVAEDKLDGCIEIQYFSGEIEEVDIDTWFEMRVVSIAAPKDWSGPYEIEKDTFSDLEELTEEGKHPNDWSDPLDEV